MAKSLHIKLLTEQLNDMTAEIRRLHQDKHMLMQAMSKLTAMCNFKQTVSIESEADYRHVKSFEDMLMPASEQVSMQLSFTFMPSLQADM